MGSRIASEPFTIRDPEEGRRSPARMRKTVVFPAPFSPRNPTVSPRPISNDTGPSARLPPKYFANPDALIMVMTTFSGPRPRQFVGDRRPVLDFSTLATRYGIEDGVPVKGRHGHAVTDLPSSPLSALGGARFP